MLKANRSNRSFDRMGESFARIMGSSSFWGKSPFQVPWDHPFGKQAKNNKLKPEQDTDSGRPLEEI